MRLYHFGLCSVFFAVSVCTAVLADEQSSPFLVAKGSRLVLNGKSYRAIGVNIPYASRAFSGQMQGVKAEDCKVRPPEEMVTTMTEAARSGFAFIRAFTYPNSPAEIEWYGKNKKQYWQKMDEFFALCRKLHLKVVPSLGMYPNAHYRPYTKENNPAILDPESRMHKLIYEFVADMVSRYKNDPNILMWEITNEGFLKADVIPAGSKDPKDLMTFAQFQQFYREAAGFIRKHDPNHLITSGDSRVRSESMANRLGTITQMDSLRDHLSNLLASQPEPLDVISLHVYGPNGPSPKAKYHARDKEGFQLLPGNLRTDDYTVAEVRAAHAAGLPVFVGELGQTNPYLNEDSRAAWLLEMMDRLESEGTSLIALWVWSFPEQPQFTFDGRSHPEIVARSLAFNRKYNTL
jgi:mannan endo-1,4-beta-mannosidase